MVTRPASSTLTSSYSAAPSACAMPPSICPRHCLGLTTTPASAAWTLCRIRSSPVPVFTATRKPWTLNATERGVPPQRPSPESSTPAAAAASYSSASGTRVPSQMTASSSSTHPAAWTCRMPAAKARIRTASSSAAARVAFPATTVPAEPKAPESWSTRSVSDCRTVIRPAVVDRAVAASWACTVVVPLPNSAVPTSTW